MGPRAGFYNMGPRAGFCNIGPGAVGHTVCHILYGIPGKQTFHAEDEDILSSHFFAHFNISTIKCTNSKSTIQHEFHVTGSRCFGTSC